jgi:E3 ubiquitin-protein ligase SHPRH
MTKVDDILFVNADDSVTDDDIKVKGSWSTKVEQIVRCLLQIQKEEPEAKTLIFSSWAMVLGLLEKAIEMNDIKVAALKPGKGFGTTIERFKKSDVWKVLLLPISSGAKGLNLTEASHVILVEPLLNPANEIQAIGRIHRIGQTKVTTVHRFVVANTIEEKIYEMFSKRFESNSMNSSRLGDASESAIITLRDMLHLFTK